MKGIASLVAAHGRGEDTQLVHMTPKEVQALQGIATLHGGSLTVNPHTGLPEAGFLSSILPIVATIVGGYFGGPAGAAVGNAAATKLTGGSNQQALLGAGLSYAGASALGGAGGTGVSATGPDALAGYEVGAVPPEGTPIVDTSYNSGIASLPDINSVLLAPAYEGTTPLSSMQTAAANSTPITSATPLAQATQLATQQGLGNAVTANAVANPLTDTQAQQLAASGGDQGTAPPATPDYLKNLKDKFGFLGDMDTYYKNGKITVPGTLGLMGIANLLGAQASKRAAANATDQYNRYSPFSPASQYRNTAPWHAAAGGLSSIYPNRPPEREVVDNPQSQVGTEPHVDPFTGQQQMAGGGIAGQPRFLKGPGDGMSDSIPASIEGKQPAALANSEFVVPADVVSHLGNGSSEAGAKHLYAMMDRVRKARTGTAKQGKQINAQKLLPA